MGAYDFAFAVKKEKKRKKKEKKRKKKFEIIKIGNGMLSRSAAHIFLV